MAEIIFDKNFPEIAKTEAEEILNEFSWLLPKWLITLYVGFHADEKESSAYITVDKDYIFANLRICGHWLTENPKIQREQIVHEILHHYNAPLKNMAVNFIERLCSEQEKEKWLPVMKESLTGENEQGTSDLTFAICSKFNESMGDVPK